MGALGANFPSALSLFFEIIVDEQWMTRGTTSPTVSENISSQPEEKTQRMRADQTRRTKGTCDGSSRLHGGLGRRLDKAEPR